MDLAELRKFSQVWLIDFEFTQRDGERPTVICLSAREYFTGKRLDLNDTQLRQGIPPFNVTRALFVAYAARAEMSCFQALGWPTPRYILDLNFEYRLLRNNGERHSHKLLDAMAYFGLPTIDAHEKREMINLAIRGAPFTPAEMQALQVYCGSDTLALQRLLPALAPHIDLLYALVRGRFAGCVGEMEHIGIPLDTNLLAWLHKHWAALRHLFIEDLQRSWDLFDAEEKLKRDKFQQFIDNLHIPYWPLTAKGWYRRDQDTLRDMAAIYTPIQALREGLDMLGQLRALKLTVGQDGRNRTPLWPTSTKTMRCAPSTTQFIFNLPPWLRLLVQPSEGHALAYLDFRQEEPAIAACLSGDPAMMRGYRIGGDLYVDFAQRALAIPAYLPTKLAKARYKKTRDQYKICLLASMYGQQEQSLASRMGQSPTHARRLLTQLRQAYPRFIQWIENEIDIAYVSGEMRSRLGWILRPHARTRETSLLNYPMQTTGSEILQRAVYLAQRAGVHVCCTVHDAILIEARIEEIAHHTWVAKEAMRQASRDILSGFELYIDGCGEETPEKDFLIYPTHYHDERGDVTWRKIITFVHREYAKSLVIPEYLHSIHPLESLSLLG